MSKIFILSCFCLVILYINYVDAQNRPGRPVKPVRKPFKTPPASVLNSVEPKGRTRQRQMQIKRRQMSKSTPLRIKPAQAVRSYQDDVCYDDPGQFPHEENCNWYYFCDEDFNLGIYSCPPETPIFDYYFHECMSEEEDGMCYDPNAGGWDEECPENVYEIAFLTGDTCEDYYICLSGYPMQWFCAPGQHWNQVSGYCDTPANAQCDPSIAPIAPSLPDCHNTVGIVPHPYDCRQFVFCQKNGSRMVQNCPHLMAFDVDLNQCVIEHNARCGTAFSQNKLKRN